MSNTAEFKLARFRFTLNPLGEIILPAYKGSTLRGGFGHSFKKVVCTLRNKECADCILKSKCVYYYVFETPPPQDSKMLRLYPKVPHPFIIEPPLTNQQIFQPGEIIPFNLILIGNAIDYLPYFIYTFKELGEIGIGKQRGRYELSEVEGIDRAGKSISIYTNSSQTIINNHPVITTEICRGVLQYALEQGERNDHITINLLTPMRLRFGGHITDHLEFHVLIRNLLRRISSLMYFHCGETLDCNFKGLIEKAAQVKIHSSELRWHDWERYSARQNQRMTLGGLVGKITYIGNLNEFIPFIKLGEYVHVGKGTTFGLGQYEILGNLLQNDKGELYG